MNFLSRLFTAALGQSAGMKKILGIFLLFVVVLVVTAIWVPNTFLKPFNIENTLRWTALFSLISIGVAFVIVTKGIDLSIGSLIAFVGCLLAILLTVSYSYEGTHHDLAAREWRSEQAETRR